MAASPSPEYHSGSDPRSLRDALGNFATGVTVVTTMAAGDAPVGLTANSFTAVSLEPPLLLVCPSRSAATTSALEECEYFAINVLQKGQEELSNLFATKGTDRFAETEFETWDHDVPIIRDALASFECRKFAVHDGGDHLILVGEITRARYATHGEPLLFYRSQYSQLIL